MKQTTNNVAILIKEETTKKGAHKGASNTNQSGMATTTTTTEEKKEADNVRNLARAIMKADIVAQFERLVNMMLSNETTKEEGEYFKGLDLNDKGAFSVWKARWTQGSKEDGDGNARDAFCSRIIKEDNEDPNKPYYLVTSVAEDLATLASNAHSHFKHAEWHETALARAAIREAKKVDPRVLLELLKAQGVIK